VTVVANDNGGYSRDETLAALPGLLTLARDIALVTLAAGDPDSDALRALLEECVVSAHRICLREQLRSGDDLVEGGPMR
jgi:hypothetical protein